MTDKNTLTLLNQCVDMLAEELGSAPLQIDRPGRGDFVLVSAATYDSLVERIHELEGGMMMDDDRDDDDAELLEILETSTRIRH
ncbi:hypothetical protein [Pseudooceanicola nanhaiensis]|uniref:hypothetical protein n=1 Tax=Pseudooceanicola nanhaiensis TaxID=375761 RepID=UPI001CD76053|nr:hypothetical protein [Pseudooceanicola nanhaiensis]MCA0920731.1 hypothetical protein [Pseudooceanicola nanhaiensis]